jgi:monomeric isocitrate dehydrogenase
MYVHIHKQTHTHMRAQGGLYDGCAGGGLPTHVEQYTHG